MPWMTWSRSAIARWRGSISHSLANNQISWIEGESFRADGRSVPVEARVVHIEFDGKPAMFFHVRDVSERHAAEMALRSSETLFRSVWENSVDGMRLTDENGVIVAVNDAFCRLIGMSQEQLEGKFFSVIYSAARTGKKCFAATANIFAPACWRKRANANSICTTGASWCLRSPISTSNPAANRACS